MTKYETSYVHLEHETKSHGAVSSFESFICFLLMTCSYMHASCMMGKVSIAYSIFTNLIYHQLQNKLELMEHLLYAANEN